VKRKNNGAAFCSAFLLNKERCDGQEAASRIKIPSPRKQRKNSQILSVRIFKAKHQGKNNTVLSFFAFLRPVKRKNHSCFNGVIFQIFPVTPPERKNYPAASFSIPLLPVKRQYGSITALSIRGNPMR